MAGERAQRATQTRARIKAALLGLIAEKGFDALTVSDVTRRAQINRGTFYLHFVDKYDMLGQLEDELIGRLEEALLDNAPARAAESTGARAGATGARAGAADLFPYETLLPALRLVAADLEFVRAISGKGGDPDFSPKLKRVIEGLLERGLERSRSSLRDDAEFPLAYSRELAVSHVLAIINLWLERGGVEAPEQVARMIAAAKDVSPSSLLRPR